MKIIELQQVPKNKHGILYKNGVKIEPHEESTAKFLTKYGFIVEVIRPVNTPKMHNPDFLIGGAIWEMKTPTTSNLKTIKKRIHEASEQAERLIVDLRKVKKNYEKVEKDVIRRFSGKATFRRMILIKKSGIVLDYRK